MGWVDRDKYPPARATVSYILPPVRRPLTPTTIGKTTFLAVIVSEFRDFLSQPSIAAIHELFFWHFVFIFSYLGHEIFHRAALSLFSRSVFGLGIKLRWGALEEGGAPLP